MIKRVISIHDLAAQRRRAEWIARVVAAMAAGALIGAILTALGIWT